ncbi:hypothetical protein ABW20_dc0105455 [Dactylellina cionopaga]|nr:hypothetical protein ABW20_dc0105455 [Dactylellina cionopaga]
MRRDTNQDVIEGRSENHLELTLDLDDETWDETTLITIERKWSKLKELELLLDGYTANFDVNCNAPAPSQTQASASESDPLNRWYSEPTTNGVFHTIAEVRRLPETTFDHEDMAMATHHDYGNFTDRDNASSDACATRGLLSEISRAISRL